MCARNLVDHLNSGGADAVHIMDATNLASCLPFQFAHSARFQDRGASLYVS